ncbi:carboxypeptidase regulatory-like domain-containing protein [Luteimonas sp. BDR2-5]|uniref:TonB-dependent receptor n=1 Tax=Proluteimonas luteida TaxID=2878685 RepID=UPI001E442875|nr:carboxypeptidase regulatory-like domain-containing protein [Luteimonas sp. BDR2-5]MCD9029777.1 carboxypeptidase regulatory-like domain-containing protein [Luteimonas sp. BDR2-5]
MTHSHRARLSKLSLGLIVALAAAPAFAQSTSAGVGGQVLGAGGQPVAGADVTIVHTESGTVSRATTDASGRYNARGLRVGGPYTITVTKAGEGTRTEDNVYLNLNQVNTVNAALTGDMTTLERVVATAVGGGSEVFSANKMGAGSNITSEQLEAMPSITRTLQDYARLDPRVAHTDKARNEISIGGQNPRYNAIRVDGINSGDTFGLETNGLSAPRQPFSMDTIDEIAVDIASYDVTISGGVGGVINAVTKSGTNNFSGSVYGLYRDNDWSGKNDNNVRPVLFDSENTWGVTFGGPIVKDKLFFFANYEKYTGKNMFIGNSSYGPIGSGASNIVNIEQSDINRIIDIARNTYGFDAGALALPSLDTESEEYGLKIDWNITDNHRASFRYGKSEQNQPYLQGFGASSLALNTYHYVKNYEIETYTLQLFSDWNSSFSTEAKVSYRDYFVPRVPLADLPAIGVRVGNSFVNLGTEENTHVNEVGTKTKNAFLAGNLFLGDHTLKFGVDYEENEIYNMYGRRLNGVYTFDSIDDFEAGTASRYQLFYPRDGVRNNIAADWTLKNLGLFVQDTWAINYNLTLSLGLRYDEPSVPTAPFHNPRAQAAFGYNNSATIDGNGLFQPRVGFNYTFDSDLPTQLRGGFGLFQGAAANVWLSNPFSNYGRDAYVDYLFTAADGGFIGFDPNPANQCALVNQQPTASCPPTASATGAEAIDFIDPDLGQPSIWKANLAFETELPWWGVVASAEGIWTRVKEAIFYQELNMGGSTYTGQDGRLMYWNAAGLNPGSWSQAGVGTGVDARTNRDRDFTNAILARSTDEGESQQYTFSLSKPFNGGDWFWQVAYTYTNATEVNPLTSSTSGSQLGNVAVFQANEEVAARSNYEIRDRFSAALTWKHAFFGDNNTSVSMFYEGRSGKPFSYTFDNDANGDGRLNDLLYIPSGPGDVLFGSPAEEAAFWAYVDGNEYLRSHKGQVAGRNADRNKWVNQFDIRISQEFPGFFNGNKAEVWLDILNVGNLIDKKWGRVEEIGFPSMKGIVEYGGIDSATGKYVYRFNTPDEATIYDDKGISRWALQVGFRYKF